MVGSCATNSFNTMATGDDTKLPLTSRDVHAERLARFRELFPEACTEGKTDLTKLAALLGDAATATETSHQRRGANLTRPDSRHREAPVTRDTPSRARWGACSVGSYETGLGKFAVF